MRLLFVLALLFATPAHAQKIIVPPEDAVERAESLIRKSNALNVFTPDLYQPDGLIAVRHTGSGLLCWFDPDSRMRVVIFPRNVSGADWGDDVACDGAVRTLDRTLYATRYPGAQTLDGQMAAAIAQIRARWSNLEEDHPSPDEVNDKLPTSRTAQFVVHDGDATFMTRVSIAVVDGWTIKMRWSGTPESASLASLAWRQTLYDLARWRAARSL